MCVCVCPCACVCMYCVCVTPTHDIPYAAKYLSDYGHSNTEEKIMEKISRMKK